MGNLLKTQIYYTRNGSCNEGTQKNNDCYSNTNIGISACSNINLKANGKNKFYRL